MVEGSALDPAWTGSICCSGRGTAPAEIPYF